MEEKLYTTKDIATKFNVPLSYVRVLSYRPHYKHFFEKRIVEVPTVLRNGTIYYADRKTKVLKPEYQEIFFKKIETAKDEYFSSASVELNRTKIAPVYNWTISAVECFSARGECEFCHNWKICKKASVFYSDNQPPMKKAVIKLLEKLGKPPLDLINIVEDIA